MRSIELASCLRRSLYAREHVRCLLLRGKLDRAHNFGQQRTWLVLIMFYGFLILLYQGLTLHLIGLSVLIDRLNPRAGLRFKFKLHLYYLTSPAKQSEFQQYGRLACLPTDQLRQPWKKVWCDRSDIFLLRLPATDYQTHLYAVEKILLMLLHNLTKRFVWFFTIDHQFLNFQEMMLKSFWLL